MGKGEPKPLMPAGGNLADWTSFFASSGDCNRGTMMPWADWRQLNKNSHDRAHCSRLLPTSRVKGACTEGLANNHTVSPRSENIRLTIQPSFAAIRTIGLTPQAAIAATASCMALSVRCQKPTRAGAIFV